MSTQSPNLPEATGSGLSETSAATQVNAPAHRVATRSRIADSAEAKMTVLIVRGAEGMAPYLKLWQELADSAAEPNVFYEPWMVLPALKTFPNPVPEFYLVFAAGHGPETPKPQLCGLFPFTRKRRFKGMRLGVLTLWKYLYCALCTPLIRKGSEAETLNALLEYCESKSGAAIMEWEHISGDGPFGQTLVDVFGERNTTSFVDDSWTRAALHPKAGGTSDDYLRNAISGKARKEYKRKENRLAEEGVMEYITLESGLNDGEVGLEARLENFLRLEFEGWKGKEGSAFACQPSHREFFMTVTQEAYKRGSLALTELRLDGQPIASKCDLIAGDCAFAFKIAFDESYSRFSPGLLLEIEGIREVHKNPKITWMDSCAVRDHFMINRLWTERRILQNLVIATGQGRGEFVVASLPLLRHFKRILRRTPIKKAGEQTTQ